MASIKCTKCGAVLKTKDPIPPGKKVKCPKCEQPFIVPEEEEDTAPKASKGDADGESAGGSAFAFGEDAGGDEADEKPSKKSKGGDKPKKSNLTLILVIVGALLLCCCCCPGVGTLFLSTNEEFMKGFNKGFKEGMEKAQKNR